MNNDQPDSLVVSRSETPKPPAGGIPEPERPVPTENPETTPAPLAAPETNTALQQPAAVETEVAVSTTSDETPVAGWAYHTDSVEALGATGDPVQQSDISWTAAEFVEHHKTVGWYVALAFGGSMFAALIYLLTKDKFSVVVILLVTFGLGLYATRRPKTQEYRVSRNGIQIGSKRYDFRDFKTFSIAQEDTIVSIVFMPLKRFMPPLTVYVVPDVQEPVINFLSSFLPFEHLKFNATDSLMRRLHF
ncbi:MAG TPA: hypothetical protein VLF69_05850 [Candidatus Saccharimonadales bacterium]|nr:hypothetical protein [Candidatus Saccharimonadales bacterium]